MHLNKSILSILTQQVSEFVLSIIRPSLVSPEAPPGNTGSVPVKPEQAEPNAIDINIVIASNNEGSNH